MTDPRDIAAQAVEHARDPRARRRVLAWAALTLALLLFTAGVGGYAIRTAQEGEDQAHLTARQARQTAAQAEADRRAALAAIGQECNAGTLPRELRFLCDQVRQIRTRPSAPPDVGEIQEREIQQGERQQPEHQQPERQQSERQNAERQQGEVDQPERQQDEADQPEPDDPEVDQPEPDDPEIDQPEPDDPEPDDPEPDDPDPNSALTFAVEDNCNPADGEFVADVGATWRRDPGTVTLVLTCTTAPVPGGVQP